MNKLIYIFFILLVFPLLATSQVLTESNLPIVTIDSNGEEINDDNKVEAVMKIYYKEDGSTNSINDAPNDFNGKIDIKLRGQTSLFLFDKKSYRLEIIDAEGKDSTVNLLGMPKESDWIMHGPFSDKSLMRNALLYTMADDILSYSPRVQMVEVIVNDDYQGVYLFTEKIKRDDSRVDIAKLKDDDIDGIELTGGYILKFDKADEEEIGWM
ncbi:MAG: CotH kinase family protein, partial [Saprospiraceae bacterium]|nr:CotH kinase family protein [Saprospiraceae bacterium]